MYFSVALVLLITLRGEFFIFGDVFLHPNDYCIMLNADGIQIYFNYAYHIKYGSGLILSNQNYPFYELIFMTDSQALLTILMNFINQHVIQIDRFSIGIFNSVLIYSIPLCSIYLYKIFRLIGIQNSLSIIFALFICFLSPQWTRIPSGHYGLGYLFYFPMLTYMLLQLIDPQKNTKKYFIYVILLLIFFGLNNGHMALAGCMWVLIFGLAWFMMNLQQKNNLALLIIVASIISLGIFLMIIHFLDFVTDREKYPWGFLVFTAQFESIFLPAHGMIHDFINRLTLITSVNEEGAAYVGIVGLFFMVYCIYRFIYFLIKKKTKRLFFPVLHRPINLLILASLPILFYSMAYPFKWGLESWLDKFPYLNQFRCPGRFSWIFFYAYSILMVYSIQLIYRSIRSKNKYVATALIGLISIFYLIDIYDFYQYNFRYLNGNNYQKNLFKPDQNLTQFTQNLQIDTNHYQAMYGLPVFNAWSSKFGIENEPTPLVHHMTALSYHSAIPWMNAKLSRISVSQIYQSVQLISHPLIEKEILGKLPKNKNVLIVHLKEYKPQHAEMEFLRLCDKISEDERFEYYSLSLHRPLYPNRDSLLKNFKSISAQSRLQRSKLEKDGMIIEKFFDNQNDPLLTDAKEDKIIFDKQFENARPGQKMEFSIWTKLDATTNGSPWVAFYSENSMQHKSEEKWFWSARSTDYQKGYVRLNFIFTIEDPRDKIVFRLIKGKNHLFERMLIRPENVNITEIHGRKMYYNNYEIGTADSSLSKVQSP